MKLQFDFTGPRNWRIQPQSRAMWQCRGWVPTHLKHDAAWVVLVQINMKGTTHAIRNLQVPLIHAHQPFADTLESAL